MYKAVSVSDHRWTHGDAIRDDYGRVFIGRINFSQDMAGQIILDPFCMKEAYLNTLSKNSEVQDIFDNYVYENDIVELEQSVVDELYIANKQATVIYQGGSFFTNHGTQLQYLNQLLDENGKLRGQIIGTIFDNHPETY
jgi:hypothetical protein